MASRRPCEISGWDGVYAVYQAGLWKTVRRITPGVEGPDGPVGPVVALADERFEHAILGRKLLQLMQRLFLALGRCERERGLETDCGGDDGVGQRRARRVAEGG